MKGKEVDGYSDLITEVAKRGLIVLTLRDFPHVKPDEACHLVWDTMRGAQAQLGIGGYADFSRIGIIGHSMGGGETISAMSMPDECGPYDTLGPLSAAVAMHPWMFEAPDPMPALASCPAMYLTGTKDTNVKPADVRAAYDASPQQKIFANGDGFNHMAPINKPVGNGRWDYYVASYFDCHLNGNGDGCTAAYVDFGSDPMLADFATWTPPPIAFGPDTSKCLDLPGGDTTNGTPLWIWDCNGRSDQWWVFLPDSWQIAYGPDQTKCVDAPSDFEQGGVLKLWDCNGGDNQRWGYDADQQTIYLAASAQASLCMDLAGGVPSAGTAVDLWACNSLPNQRWELPSQSESRAPGHQRPRRVAGA